MFLFIFAPPLLKGDEAQRGVVMTLFDPWCYDYSRLSVLTLIMGYTIRYMWYYLGQHFLSSGKQC